MPSFNLHLVVIFGFCTQMIIAECPRLCECKWKNGKESVICLNANLSIIPLHLEAGTQVLDLTGNNLITIIKHDEFSNVGLLNLQKVYISKCRLKNLERYAFRNLINLVELDLSYNILTSVPSHVFDSVSELRELKLNGNPIQRIINDAFINVPQLIRLELSDCRINTIQVRAFHGLEKTLEWLKLDKNKLIQVSSLSFTILQNLHGLELSANPWNCSCILRPLREWMLRQNVPFDIPPICQYPKRLNTKPWDKLDLDEFACVPEIFAYDNKAHGVEGKNVTMTCKIAGVPEPSVRWLLKNKVIANLSGSSYSNGKKLYMVHLQNNSSNLTIFSTDLQDAGIYICAAENKAGRAEASVTLAVTKRPPENNFSNKVIIASIITGVAFALASCLITLCVCSVRKKQILTWRNRECHREDNYEKIEMNHKVSDNSNGGTVQVGDIATVANRRNGEYRVVPAADVEVEDEEDNSNIETIAPKIIKNWNNDSTVEKLWNSPEHLLDPEDLHIPRRTLQEARDDIKKIFNSTSGTYNYYHQQQPSTSCPISQPISSHILHRQIINGTGNNIYTTTTTTTTTTTQKKDFSNVFKDESIKRYPDLIENSASLYKFNSTVSIGKANSEGGGSVNDITELFCTLPRKRALMNSSRYKSNDSQSPLLSESRYGSSGGSESSYELNLRRLSESQKYSMTNLNRNRENRISTSYLNLTRDENVVLSTSTPNSTPLLDVSNLENHLSSFKKDKTCSSSNSITPIADSYDYHAAQLERFLEEYRSLQKQLSQMKETCDNFKNNKTQYHQTTSPITPSYSDESSSKNLFKSNTVNNLTVSPNSNQSLEDSIDFRNFESELTKYLLAKNSSPKPFNNSGVFNE